MRAQGRRLLLVASMALPCLAPPATDVSAAPDPPPAGPPRSWIAVTAMAPATHGTAILPSLAFDPEGNPRIAFQGTHGLHHATRDGDAWDIEVVDADTGFNPGAASLAVDGSGDSHLAFLRMGSPSYGRLMHATNESGTWTLEEIADSASVLGPRFLVVDSAGIAHLAYSRHVGDDWEGGDFIWYATNASGEWVRAPLPWRGHWPSLAVDASGSAHIGFVEFNRGSGLVRYATNDSGSWQAATVDKARVQGPPSMALDSRGHPLLAYAVRGRGKPGRELVVRLARRSSEEGWTTEAIARGTPGPGDSLASDVSLAMDDTDHAHIAFARGSGLVHATDASGAFVEETVEAGGAFPSISVRGSTVHVAHSRGWNATRYVTGTTGSWSGEYVGKGQAAGAGVSLAIDAGGGFHACHNVYRGGGLTYTTDSPGVWTSETVDSLSAEYTNPSIVLDDSGRAHIGYVRSDGGTGSEVRYATNASGSWESEVVEALPTTSDAASIALDAAGRPRIAYSSFASSIVRYARRTEGGWTTETVSNAVGDGGRVSLGLDASDRAHIAFCRGSDLIYAADSPGSWVEEIVDTETREGRPSLALDGAGRPGIAYLGTDLRYASRESGAWVSDPVPVIHWSGWSVDYLSRPTLVLDGAGAAYISFSGGTDAAGYGLACASNASGTWKVALVDAGSSTAPNLGFTSSGRGLVVEESSGSAIVGVSPFGFRAMGAHSDIRLGPDGLPRIAYTDDARGTLKSARPDDGTAVPAVTVDFEASSGTATEGSDFTGVRGTLGWGPGDTGAKSFTVPILDDGEGEGPESVSLKLANPSAGATLRGENGALTIRDNDGGNGTLVPNFVCIRGPRWQKRLEIDCVLDTGIGQVDLSGRATLSMGSLALPIDLYWKEPGMLDMLRESGSLGADLWHYGGWPGRYRGHWRQFVSAWLTRESADSSRWFLRVVLRYSVEEIDPDSPLTIRFENPDLDASGTVELVSGRYRADRP